MSAQVDARRRIVFLFLQEQIKDIIITMQAWYWQCESDEQPYAWAEPTSEADTRTTRATHHAEHPLLDFFLFTLCEPLSSSPPRAATIES